MSPGRADDVGVSDAEFDQAPHGIPRAARRPLRIAGDADGDGLFTSVDLVRVFQIGEYEDSTPHNSTFAEGDWNGDGDFTSEDIVAAFQSAAYLPTTVDLVLQQLGEDTQPEPWESRPGGFVAWNDDDDNGNELCDRDETHVGGEDDLVLMRIVAPVQLKRGILQLETVAGSTRVDLWLSGDKAQKIGSAPDLAAPAGVGIEGKSAAWDLSQVVPPTTVWVEGIQRSEAAADVEFRLSLILDDLTFVDANLRFTVVDVDLDVDTDRSGVIDPEADESGEDTWSASRGAIYSVNFDRDGQRVSPGGSPLPDAIHFDDSGRPVHEDYTIENVEDARDLAPLVIRRVAPSIPEPLSVFLQVAEAEDLRGIHLYKKIEADASNVAIWGSAMEAPTSQELDITDWVNPLSPDFQGDVSSGDVTFGLEGLLFRYLGVNVPPVLQFDGEIDLQLQLRAGATVISSDVVRLKVAPWMTLSADQASEEVWAMELAARNDEFLFNRSADPGYRGLDDSRQLRTIRGMIGQHWLQDHVEIGYTQRPGGPATHVVFRLPYHGLNPEWPLTNLLGPDVGIFQLGGDLGGGGGDHGGNLETLSPTGAHPLGRVALGNTASPALRDFLASQEIQDPLLDLPTDWLLVGHLDEVTSFLAGSTIAIADSALAWSLISDTNTIPVADRFRTVFFASGARPEAGTVGSSTATRLYDGPAIGQMTTVEESRLVDGETLSIKQDATVERIFEIEQGGGVADGHIAIDLSAMGLSTADEVRDILIAAINQAGITVRATAVGPATIHLWNEHPGVEGNQPIVGRIADPGFVISGMQGGKSEGRNFTLGPWDYVRTAGQVAHIKPGGRHDGWLEIDRVWNTTSKIVPGGGAAAHLFGYAQFKSRGGLGEAPNRGIYEPAAWWSSPAVSDPYVLVEDTKFFSTGTPAVVTVDEILSDPDFELLNRTLVPAVMHEMQQKLQGRTSADTRTFLPVPALFFGEIGAHGTIADRSAVAFNPGPTNLQVVNGRLYVPRQFGPQDSDGRDILEAAIRESLPATAEFVDSWDLYHRYFGEVHCGTLVKRTVPDLAWWA